MRRKLRILAIAATALTAVLVLALGVAFYVIKTSWFRNKVRERVIAAIEQATGGTVELSAFNYNWRSLTAEFRNLIVRGNEPAGAQPLFRANSIRLGLKIVSAFERNIDIASLVVDRPQVHLLIGRDGTTNLPSPKAGRLHTAETVEALLNLKVKRLEFRDGLIEANAREVPLDARGNAVFVLLTYDRLARRYDAHLGSQRLQLISNRWPEFDAWMDARVQLAKDRLTVQQAEFRSNASRLQASGALLQFSRPVAEFHIAVQVDGADLGKRSALSALRAGQLTADGTLHYDESASFTFSGRLAGTQLECRSGSFFMRNASFASNVRANLQGVMLQHLTVNALGARLTGEAEAARYRELRLDGSVSGLGIREFTALFHREPLPYGAIANGHVHLQAGLDRPIRDLLLQTKLQLAPARPGIPVSGNLEFTYRQARNLVEFGSSSLRLPSTQVSFSGAWGEILQTTLDTTNISDIEPALILAAPNLRSFSFPVLTDNGRAHFDGALTGLLHDPLLAGNFQITHFHLDGKTWDQVQSRVVVTPKSLEFSSAVIDSPVLHATGSGRIGLADWGLNSAGVLRLQMQFSDADLSKFPTRFRIIPFVHGVAAGSADFTGSLTDPHGNIHLNIGNLDAYGETLDEIHLTADVQDGEIRVSRGDVKAGPALVTFSGSYKRGPQDWGHGDLRIQVSSNGFPLAGLAYARRYEPGLNARFEIHAEGAAHVTPDRIEPTVANGTAVFRNVTVNNVPYGNITFNASTHGQVLDTKFSGELRESRLSGDARVQLVGGNPAKGELQLDKIQLSTLAALLDPARKQPLPVDGFLSGGLSFEGPLRESGKLHGTVNVHQLELTSGVGVELGEKQSSDLVFRNLSPIILDASNGAATIRSFQIGGKDSSLSLTGAIPYLPHRALHLNIRGAMDLRFFQLLDPNVHSSGLSLVSASVEGMPSSPAVSGTLELKNGAFFFKDVPNGLTAVTGSVKFDRNRATIEKLTAQTGGGELALGGFVRFGASGPLIYRLEANAQNVRVRYAGGISVTGNSQLRLTGSSESSMLSGTATISRVVLNPNSDVGSLLTALAVSAQASANEKDFFTGMQFDVHFENAPNVQFNTELSRDLQADIDLHLRGTPAHPVLLGDISANQGDIKVFGAKYSINRGDVSFVNPVKIDPVLNLDLQTVVRGITVDITISGQLGRLNINYRSDPPLQPRDIIALLTVGRTPVIGSSAPTAQLTNDVTALQSSASTVLGQALSSSSSSSPLSKLFGVTNIRIDPMALQGISTTPQARLTVEQDISRQITVTYVTNLSQTAEQIFRLEWAFSANYSVVALRDDNGEFGLDIQYRKRFK